MKIQRNKDRLIIDHDEHYIPIVKTATGEVQVTASFSLAELGVRSGERLERLVDFIRRHRGRRPAQSQLRVSRCVPPIDCPDRLPGVLGKLSA